jgi:long-subunit fatty acid transport protein
MRNILEAKFVERKNLHNERANLLSGKRMLAMTLIVWASFVSCLCAIEINIPLTTKPLGSGARALGQSAFIAVADDATAASWNPAGLINLERPEASFVGAWKSVEEDYSIANPLESSSPESWSDWEINFMSYAQPLLFDNTDVVMSVNYHQVYDFGAEFNSYETQMLRFGGKRVIDTKKKSEGVLSAYTLACGLSVPDRPEITVGVGINWYAQSLLSNYAWQIKSIKTETTYEESKEVSIVTLTDTFDNFRAHNFTLGLLWDVYEKQENLLTLGLVYHTPFTSKVDWELVKHETDAPTYRSGNIDMDIDFPSSLGGGVNYRFSDSLSAAFDVEWKKWSKYTQESADGTRTSPFNDDKNKMAYRLGFEHLSLPKGAGQSVYAVRYGAFYEPRPARDEIMSVYGLSAGFGWTLMGKFSLDFAYQYRWGEEELEDFDYDYKIKEQFLLASIITYF